MTGFEQRLHERLDDLRREKDQLEEELKKANEENRILREKWEMEVAQVGKWIAIHDLDVKSIKTAKAENARLAAEKQALRDVITELKRFVDGERQDTQNIAELLNAVWPGREQVIEIDEDGKVHDPAKTALRDLLGTTVELLQCMDDFVAGSRLCPSRLAINHELTRLRAAMQSNDLGKRREP